VRDLQVQEFLRELVVDVTAPTDLAGSILVEFLHSIEGGDVKQVCSNLEIILPCLRLLISLSHTHLCLYISYAYIIYLFICLIYLRLNDIAWDYLLTLVFNQESHSGTSAFNLEKSRGDSSEPFTGNSATLLLYVVCLHYSF